MGRLQRRALAVYICITLGYIGLAGALYFAMYYLALRSTDIILGWLLIVLFFPGLIFGTIMGMRRARVYDTLLTSATAGLVEQPDPADAMRDGEVLFLARHATKRGRWVTFLGIAIPLYGMMSVLLNSKNDMFVTFIICAGLVLSLISVSLSFAGANRQTITADDRGITVKSAYLPARNIAWSDIRGVICTSSLSTSPIGKEYLLVGRRRNLQLSLVSYATTLSTTQRNALEAVEGDSETYIRNIKRLLATLVARTQAPLKNYRLATKMVQRHPYSAFSAAAVLAMPNAPAHLQPQVDAMPHIKSDHDDVILQPRPPYIVLSIISLVILIPLLSLIFAMQFAIVVWEFQSWYVAYWLTSEAPMQLLASGIVLCLLFPVLLLAAVAQYRQQRPILIATRQGLARSFLRTHGRNATQVMMPWEKMRAWAVMALPHHNLYVLYADNMIYHWYEKPTYRQGGKVHGDRRAQYHEHAERLHWLIIEKTGLRLREITLS